MNYGIVLLICFIVPEIHLGCGDDSQRLHPRQNLGNYIILRNIVQEDFIDLNSIKPDVLMKLESNMLNEEEKVQNESVQGLLYPSKNPSQGISMPQGESNLEKSSTAPKNYLEGNKNPRYENVDDSIHQVKYRQKHKELEAIDTKYTKKYSEKTKNVQLITKNVEPLQENNLMEGKEKKENEPQQNKAEKQIIYHEKKENIVLNKKLLNLQKSTENENPFFKPKLKELSGNDRGKIEETKGQKKSDYRIPPSTFESSRGQMFKPDKLSMNKDQNGYYNGPFEFTKKSRPMNQTKTTDSGQMNPKSYLDLDHNLLQTGNFLIAKVTSKKGDIASNDQILLNKSRNSFNPTRKPFENTFTTSTKAKANNMHGVQNSAKTFPVGIDNVLPNYEEKVGEGYLSSDYNNGQKKTGSEKNDINDLIQVDVYGAFFHKPTNNTLRQKKNIDETETDQQIAPWNTVDMVITGFVLLTIFVLGTIIIALRVKKKRRKKRRVYSMDSEVNGSFDETFSSPSRGDGPERLRSLSPPKMSYAKQERNLARFSTTDKWQMSESNETGGGNSDHSDKVSWSEPTEPSSTSLETVRYHKQASRKNPTHPETVKNVETRSVSSMTLPSLPTVRSSSSAPTSEDIETPSYSFRNNPGYIPSSQLPSLPTVSSSSSNMSDS